MLLNLFALSDDLLAFTIIPGVRAHSNRETGIGRTEQRQNISARFPAPSLPNLGLDQILGSLDGDSSVLPCKGETLTR